MLCVVDAVAQDADKPSDQLLGSLGVCRDKIADIVQRIINKVGIDLRLKILHLHPVVHFGKSDVALAQLLNAADHLVDLTGDLLDLIAGVDLDDVIRVLLADDADLPHEGVHRLYHLLSHSVHDTGEHCCPAQPQQYDQEQTHEEITVIRGRVDEGVSQHRAVFQRAAAAQIAIPVHSHILRCIGGQILVSVFLGEEGGV